MLFSKSSKDVIYLFIIWVTDVYIKTRHIVIDYEK